MSTATRRAHQTAVDRSVLSPTLPLRVEPPHPSIFQRAAGWTIRFTGGRWGFFSALLVVIIWAITGPLFEFSELWQLVINTGTTIVTFLMVFLIQNAQNRESKAVHLKLDELIYAVKSASNAMINIEDLTEEQLDHLAERYRRLAERHHRLLAAQQAQAEAVIERRVEQRIDHRLQQEIDRKLDEKVEEEVGRKVSPRTENPNA